MPPVSASTHAGAHAHTHTHTPSGQLPRIWLPQFSSAGHSILVLAVSVTHVSNSPTWRDIQPPSPLFTFFNDTIFPDYWTRLYLYTGYILFVALDPFFLQSPVEFVLLLLLIYIYRCTCWIDFPLRYSWFVFFSLAFSVPPLLPTSISLDKVTLKPIFSSCRHTKLSFIPSPALHALVLFEYTQNPPPLLLPLLWIHSYPLMVHWMKPCWR